MKKIIFALCLLAGGILFIINYLGNITGIQTDKIKMIASNQLTATENKPEPAKTQTKKQDVIEQITNAITPAIKQATEEVIPTTENKTDNTKPASNKPPIATIKFYDKKTAKETVIDSSVLLDAEQQKLSSEDQQKLQEKNAKFRAYYQKPEKCLTPATKEIRIECANEYMRAKAKFEELYRERKL